MKTTKTTTTELTYKEELTQTSQAIEAEELENKVETAKNEFEMGMLAVKGKILIAQSDLKKEQSKITSAEVELKKAKRSEPNELTQNLIDAFQKRKQAVLDVETKAVVVTEIQEIYDFLEETKKVLFA